MPEPEFDLRNMATWPPIAFFLVLCVFGILLLTMIIAIQLVR